MTERMSLLRRLSTAVALACLLVPALAACGSDDGDADATGSVSVSGAFGEAPEVTYETPYAVPEIETAVLEKGDGDVLEQGDLAFLNIYVGNGYNGEVATSSWPSQMTVPEEETEEETSEGKKNEKKNKKDKLANNSDEGDTEGALTADEEKPTPEMVTVNSESTLKPIYDGILGQPVGTRVRVSAPGEDAFGYGGAEYGIGNADTTVFVIDIVSKTAAQLDASDAESEPKNLPSVVESEGKVTGLDFSNAPKKAGDELRVVTLLEGSGKKVKKGDRVALRYLGQRWGKKKVFDSNYDAEVPGVGGSPATITDGALIDGWVQGLPGVKEGSRVMLVIPSDLGYGEQGSGDDIPPNSDLVFVIDVLAVV